MATCKQTAFELIQDIFSPCVAILCSSDVDQICAKNNLTFVEMVQPFCRLNAEVTIRDPNNIPCAIKNFRVTMKDLHSQPPSISVGKKMMHDAVATNVLTSSDSILMNTFKTENYYLKYCPSTPWFEAFREVFFQVTSPTEHEFVHNYLSCVFVVSSSHQDPLSQIHELSQQLLQHQQSTVHNSKWFFSYVFMYYLLLHDVSSEDLAKAETVYQSMKSSFGPSSCHLLQINSGTPSAQSSSTVEETNSTIMPDPWSQFLPKYTIRNDAVPNNHVEENHYDASKDKSGDGPPECIKDSDSIHHPLLYSSESAGIVSDTLLNTSSEEIEAIPGYTTKLSKSRQKRHGICLTLSDMDRIKCFIQDFCVQGLIPFVEKQVRILNDQVANRKGIHRTIFGVTKKFFSNKPGAQNPASSLNSVVYGPDAPELQVRKLGDLAFMFQLYEVAYQAYHNAKRDFSADQAWLHFAGASEMAALSVFMQNSTVHEYPARYIESAITTYLHTCKLPELATRATFLSTECLKAKGLYRDAAAQFIRMPSDADLPSALCLEQAAYCYLNCRPPKIRKYAFHVILAGHRFSKAGQRKHALRSYKQAEQVYSTVGWNFANNHINFTIGRLSIQLDQLESACSAFEPLLVSKCQLPPVEQANYLREYLYILKKLISLKKDKSLPVLPVPLIKSEVTKVLLAEDVVTNENGPLYVTSRGFDRGDKNNHVWAKLEEIVVNRVLGCPVYNNQVHCFTEKTNNVTKPNAIVGEVISIEIVLKNPLSVALIIDDVHPLWTFVSQSSSGKEPITVTNEMDVSKAMLLNSVVQTKVLSRVILEPHQEKKVYLLLTPQKVGELSIKGIAYNLLSLKTFEGESVPKSISPGNVISLQGKKCLTVKGPRLNKTTEERATVMYADDNRLNINILSSMAKLQVKFQNFPFTLFCGEIQKVMAEFTNVGQHQLRRIIMASPVPGIFALGSPGEAGEPHAIFKEITSSDRQSPVIAKWESDWMIEILMPDGEPCVLDPGASVEIPVWFKGPDDPGDHDLDILFYYQSEPSNQKLKYRVLQLSTVLVTHPSVSLQAKAMRSFCSEDKSSNFHPAAMPNSLVLGVEVGNISKELEQINLVQISCISKDWCLLPSEEIQKGLSGVHPDETLLLTIKAISFDPKHTVSSQEVKVFSHIPLGRTEIDSSSTPCSDFSQNSSLDLRAMLSVCNPSSIKELDKPRMDIEMIVFLVVIWKAKIQRNGKDCIITGQHHVAVQNLASPIVPVKSPSVEQIEDIPLQPQELEVDQLQSNVPSELMVTAMIKCSLSHPFHVQHDFKTKKVVLVPIEFIACSTSDVELHLVINNSHHESVNSYNLDETNNQITQRFTWISGSKSVILVKPHSTVQLPLKAMFCGPGTYNLGSLNILVNCSKDVLLPYLLPPDLIVISHCNTT